DELRRLALHVLVPAIEQEGCIVIIHALDLEDAAASTEVWRGSPGGPGGEIGRDIGVRLGLRRLDNGCLRLAALAPARLQVGPEIALGRRGGSLRRGGGRRGHGRRNPLRG